MHPVNIFEKVAYGENETILQFVVDDRDKAWSCMLDFGSLLTSMNQGFERAELIKGENGQQGAVFRIAKYLARRDENGYRMRNIENYELVKIDESKRLIEVSYWTVQRGKERDRYGIDFILEPHDTKRGEKFLVRILYHVNIKARTRKQATDYLCSMGPCFTPITLPLAYCFTGLHIGQSLQQTLRSLKHHFEIFEPRNQPTLLPALDTLPIAEPVYKV